MTDRFILEAFWNTQSNCVITAFIKAILTLKNRSSLLRIRRRGNYWYMKVPDGRLWCFTSAEISDLNSGNKFIFRHASSKSDQKNLNRLKITVRSWYAIAVRSLQVYGYEKKELTVSEAKQLLTKEGMRSGDFHRLLGIRRTPSTKLSLSNLRRLQNKKGILLYNTGHIIAAASGLYDRDGEAVSIGNKLPIARNRKLTYYFQVRV
jgi:hypothetical protein